MPKRTEDLIDFPCSPTWVAWYASQCMTDDYPDDFYRSPLRPDPEVLALRQEVESLREQLADLYSQLASLVPKARTVPAIPANPPKVRGFAI